LTYRVALLVVAKGVEPGNILAITFTNKAAEEMRERITGLVGEAASSIWITTFHSACARILRREAERLGYRRNFVIYDEDDQLRMISQVMNDLKVDRKRYPPRLIRSLVEGAKNEMVGAEEYAERAEDELESVTAEVYRRYQENLFRNNAMDFSDLLLNTVTVFERFPAVLEHYRRKFRYINVDEYQDTNRPQYLIVRFLSEEHRNLCVVGDDDQGIYSWRGADLRNILEFEKDYPDCRVVRLERNYRSTRNILEAANHVVSLIPGRKAKRLWTDRSEGEPIYYLRAVSGDDEAAFVAGEIARLSEERGYDFRDIAVFYRTNAQSRSFEEAFSRLGIPYKIVGGFKFYERKEVKDLLSYMKFLLNPDDAVSLRRIVNEPKRGIGKTTLAHLESFARIEGITLWEAMTRAGEAPALSAAARRRVGEFVRIMKGLMEDAGRLSVPDLVREILERSGYRAALAGEGTFEAEGRLENLQELLNAAAEFHMTHPGEGLEQFLEMTSLVAEIDLYDEEEGAVTLMTLHNAKGLEFSVVFIVGMEDGVFPHLRCMEEEERMAEERRLFYVGVTRAKDLLYLTGAAYRSRYGDFSYHPESRFLQDIPSRYLEVLSEGPAEESLWSREAEEEKARLDRLAASFRVGDRVVHDLWGEGVVTALSMSGSGPEVTVRFFGEGEKLLLLQYAPLRKIG
jgi:DNA helicase-2/ATP-dependent DNA helicase PcrA